MMLARVRVLLSAIVLACAAPASFAGLFSSFVCGGCATEDTQIANFAILLEKVVEQTETVKQLNETRILQVIRLNEAIKAGRIFLDLPVSDALQARRELDGYQAVLRRLGRDVTQLNTVFDTRLTEAKLMGVTLNDYMRREAVRVESGNTYAKARWEREMRLVDQVQLDIQQTRDWGLSAAGTVGIHQSAQLFNAQLNLMATQLTRMVTMTAERQGSDRAEAAMREAEDRQSLQSTFDAINRAQQDLDQRNSATLKGLGR